MKFNENYVLFKKDWKKLAKKYNYLEEDFKKFKLALEKDEIRLTGVVRIPLGSGIEIPFYKATKFRSKNFIGKGSKSGIRITFSFEKEDEESEPIVNFIEIYSKNKQKNHNEARIKSFYKEQGENE